MQKKIIRREYQEDLVTSLHDFHPVLRRIYAARHIQSPHELDRELDRLLPYQSMLGMEQAIHLLAQAIAQQQKILIVGDFDADGATSTALAMRALRSFGAKHVQFLVPNRFSFGYGLTPELVAVAKTFSPDLIVTVDNGIANHAGVSAAKSCGMQVIITDHHLPGETVPEADAIVNPNQRHDTFPSKNLAGVGVIFYVMLALRRHLTEQGFFSKQNLPEPNMSRLLDLVALGTVADLVPLDHNNRILVHQGLRRIRAGLCVPGMIALFEMAGKDFAKASTGDLGFFIASRLNAAGRLDDMSLGIECLLCDDPVRVREMARTLDQLNEERRDIEQTMHAQAMQAMHVLHKKLQGELPRGICLYDESWHQGVIGILASRIKDRFHRPVIVFAPGNAEELKGSARSVPGLHIRDALAQVATQYPELISKFGGHAMAAGLTISRHLLDNFVQAFDEVVSRHINESSLQHCLLSDGELNPEDFNLELAGMIRDGGPWGQTFPEPLFDNMFRLLEQRLVGDKHLKMRLASGDQVLDAIAFNINMDEWPNHRCQAIRVAYRLDVNEFRGKQSVQLIVEYMEPATL